MSALLKQVAQSVRLTLSLPNVITVSRSRLIAPELYGTSLNFQLTNVRYRYNKIRGGGRPLPEGMIPPKQCTYGWRPVLPADGEYTTKPLPIVKLGGRDPETGRVVVRTIGGGHKKKFRWVDFKREAPKDGSTLVEKVYDVRYDPCRTADIALVASSDHKRWILASHNMKVGDLIETSGEIPKMPVTPRDGNAHPVGALPAGTLIHNIEREPGQGGAMCRVAGSAATLVRKVDNTCIIQLPSKQQVIIDERCMAVCGRVSNVGHGDKHIGSANRLRWLGKRPRSGLWHRKDGYCGRKIHPPKTIKDLLQPRIKEPDVYTLNWSE